MALFKGKAGIYLVALGLLLVALFAVMAKAREGRMFIMNKMLEVIDRPNAELSPYAPRLTKMQIHPDRIREIIGPGGKTIHKIVDETGCKIDIEDDGSLYIMSVDEEGAKKAKFYIESIIADVEVGKTYMGTVKRIMESAPVFIPLTVIKRALPWISGKRREERFLRSLSLTSMW
jgi:polyribonucleotide nucleotidyltransferase